MYWIFQQCNINQVNIVLQQMVKNEGNIAKDLSVLNSAVKLK